MTEADYLRLIDETNAAGPFRPTWESLAQMEIPAWFTREHLGIFIHWGAYCVPAATDEWYPRNMYMKEKPAFAHHLKAFGPHREIGYKDIIPMFRAERFDPAEWMTLFRRAGAGYVFPVAEHHDGFQMYKSELSHWNAAEKGPCRDVLGELRAAAEREGLHFCTSSHRVEHWWFMCHGREFDSDIHEPLQKGDLYWPAMPEPADHEDQLAEPAPSEEFMNDWLARTAELIVCYQPSLIYFDWWVQHRAVTPYLKRIAAFYYNCGAKWDKPVAICYKHDAMQPGTGIADVERGGFDRPMPFPWQTDTAVARNSWCYTETLDYKPSAEIIATLVDTVSKNGNMLLNVGPRADGTIAPGDRQILTDLASWMDVNGNAVRGARPFKIAGEGPTASPAGEFSDSRPIVYTPSDFRFTVNGGKVYATALRCPEDGRFTVRTFARGEGKPRFWGIIDDVRVLGYDGTAAWRVDAEGLHVDAPGLKSDWPVTLEISAV